MAAALDALGPLGTGTVPSSSDTRTASPSPSLLETADAFPFPPQKSQQQQQQQQLAPFQVHHLRSQSLAVARTAAAPPPIEKPPARRKPLSSSTVSPLVVSKYPPGDCLQIAHHVVRPDQRFSRSHSVDSPTLYDFPLPGRSSTHPLTPVSSFSEPLQPGGPSTPVNQVSAPPDCQVTAAGESPSRNTSETNPEAAQTTDYPSHYAVLTTDRPTTSSSQHSSSPDTASSQGDCRDGPTPSSPDSERRFHNLNTNTIMTAPPRKPVPSRLTLEPVDSAREHQHITTNTATTPDRAAFINKPLPKSPGSSKLASILGWVASPTSTEYSEKPYSPIPSLPSPFSSKPRNGSVGGAADDSPTSPKTFRPRHANASDENPLDYCEAYLQTPPAITTTTPNNHIEEMEDELKAISAELAASIRREMDLDDLVERLQEQVNNPQAPGKRTSDYYSDSGYSSAKFSDYDQAKEEISQVQRKAEQEKAQIRLELTNKLQDERDKRRQLDRQIEELSRRASQIDIAQVQSKDSGGRIKELEGACDGLRRRLSEERQTKENFEDLLSGLESELRDVTNERDNLRDEVVPQLRARVEGLEAEASENAKLAYDTTKMQQEIQFLKDENSELRDSGAHPEPPSHPGSLPGSRPGSRMSVGITRSASIAGGGPPFKVSRPPSLVRSNTNRQLESRDALAERVKDVEAQRDALHSALKNLLERQDLQNRENEKKIKVLEVERDRLLSSSPRRAGYEKDVSNLRGEISVLRRRAEEAIEQKWQVEKGLSGLKMDLDRAESEIGSLQQLLKANDILIPESPARASRNGPMTGPPVSSASLDKAYRDLQAAYKEALERIKALEQTGPSSERTRLAVQRLEQSLAAAAGERDLARQEAESSRAQLDSYRASEKAHVASEAGLAEQLQESARRVEELSRQVQDQLAANASLRTRLSDTVSRGEASQLADKERIAGIQSRLRTLEEQLVAAQTANEERVGRHEEEIASLKDAHSTQLQRLRDAAGGLRSPRLFPAKASPSPLLSPGLKSPRPSVRRSSSAPSEAAEAAEVETLKNRVKELERALSTADQEMQDVVARMSTAQIEVLTLQEEREEAVRQTRRLQRQLEEEKVKAFEDKFKTITAGK